MAVSGFAYFRTLLKIKSVIALDLIENIRLTDLRNGCRECAAASDDAQSRDPVAVPCTRSDDQSALPQVTPHLS
jgi:hypothetical protein